MDVTYEYVKGNRLPVPSKVLSKHFFYQAQTQPLAEADVQAIVGAVKEFVMVKGIEAATIEAIGFFALAIYGEPGVQDAYKRVVGALFPEGDYDVRDTGILVCEWAMPHVDDTYEGVSFLNVVLSTGPLPYVMQTMHSRVGYVQELDVSTRVLKAGDVVIFDPTTPHFTAPLKPHQDCLLVMLQVELKDKTAEERVAILEKFPPIADDKDAFDLFRGLQY